MQHNMNQNSGNKTIITADEETHLLTSSTTTTTETQEYTNGTKATNVAACAVASSTSTGTSAVSTTAATTTTLWGYYLVAIDTYPIVTKCVTATIILSLADVVAQIIEFIRSSSTIVQPRMIDILRTMRFGLLGLLGAPWSHYYFYYLDYYLPPSISSDKYYPFTLRTIIKVAIDQCVQAPILLAIMILVLGCLKGGVFSNCIHEARHDISTTFMTSLIANCTIICSSTLLRYYR
jgi:hypothetical protein